MVRGNSLFALYCSHVRPFCTTFALYFRPKGRTTFVLSGVSSESVLGALASSSTFSDDRDLALLEEGVDHLLDSALGASRSGCEGELGRPAFAVVVAEVGEGEHQQESVAALLAVH